MHAVFGMLLTAAIVIGLVVGWASILKYLAFRFHTRDGDTFGNRLTGHGPENEVGPSTAREEWDKTVANVRRRFRAPRG